MSEKQKEGPRTGLVWFRNDLRVADQASLRQAVAQCGRVVGLFVFDPRWLEPTRWGFPRMGRHRVRFLLECLDDLRGALADLGIALHVRVGEPVELGAALCNEIGVTDLYFQHEWTRDERVVELGLREALPSTAFHGAYDQFLVDPTAPPLRDWSSVPEVFTKFRKKVERDLEPRPPEAPPAPASTPLLDLEPLPTLASLGLDAYEHDPRSAFPFSGGAASARARIEQWFWRDRALQTYKATRNELLGHDYSSKLSPWLALGCISPRQVYAEVRRFEDEVVKNKDTYWLIFELLWREYFKYIALKHGDAIFHGAGIRNRQVHSTAHRTAIEEWTGGRTGTPFVDANMVELERTGYMSNRGRQNVASFWAKTWKQDWRIGAAYFESQLIDYDVHSNWGNWMYLAGVGNDPRDRTFNVALQAERYDLNGEYVRTWLE